MTTSIIIGAVIIIGILAWFIVATKKQKRRLDDLHITSEGKAKK